MGDYQKGERIPKPSRMEEGFESFVESERAMIDENPNPREAEIVRLRELVADERMRFIRQAAIAIRATHVRGDPRAAWEAARQLWDSKPSDV